MQFPRMIEDFILHHTNQEWSYKKNSFYYAKYIKVGAKTELEIRTVFEPEGSFSFEIEASGCFIRNIKSLEQAIQITREIIQENQ